MMLLSILIAGVLTTQTEMSYGECINDHMIPANNGNGIWEHTNTYSKLTIGNKVYLCEVIDG